MLKDHKTKSQTNKTVASASVPSPFHISVIFLITCYFDVFK